MRGGGLRHRAQSAGKIESQQLFVKELAGDPSKEVNAQSYTFPIGAVLPWHIHPDADEIAYTSFPDPSAASICLSTNPRLASGASGTGATPRPESQALIALLFMPGGTKATAIRFDTRL